MADVVGIIALIICIILIIGVGVALYFGISGFNKAKSIQTGALGADSALNIEGIIIVNGKNTLDATGKFTTPSLPSAVFKNSPIIQITPVDPAVNTTLTPFFVSNVSNSGFTVNGVANNSFYWTATGAAV